MVILVLYMLGGLYSTSPAITTVFVSSREACEVLGKQWEGDYRYYRCLGTKP